MKKKLVHINIPNGSDEDLEEFRNILDLEDYEFIITIGKKTSMTVDATPILEEIRDLLKQIQANTGPRYELGAGHFPT